MAKHITATHATVRELTRKIEGRGHKLYVDSLFSSPELFDDLVKNRFTVVVKSGRGMPQELRPKTTELKM